MTIPISAEQRAPDKPAVAELQNVVHRFGKVTALEGVNLALAPGQVTALLGPNGAGKTTAVRLLLGSLRPTHGTARLFGLDPTRTANRVRSGAMLQVGKVPETLRVGEHIELFMSYYPKPMALSDVLEATGLGGLEKRSFGKLSGGQKQRLLFALAICGNPELLFLDEPTVGLDVEARRLFWEQIRRLVEAGRTVLLTTHYLEEADALADRVVVIDHGKLVADGSPAQIKARAASRRIRCVTRLSADVVRDLPGVRQVRRDTHALEVLTGEAEPLLARLLALDPDMTDLEVQGAGLEEAFLHLTRSSANTAEQKGAA